MLEDSEVLQLADPPYYINKKEPVGDSCYHIRAENIRAGLPVIAYLDCDRPAELAYVGDALMLATEESELLTSRGECVVYRIDNSKKNKW